MYKSTHLFQNSGINKKWKNCVLKSTSLFLIKLEWKVNNIIDESNASKKPCMSEMKWFTEGREMIEDDPPKGHPSTLIET